MAEQGTIPRRQQVGSLGTGPAPTIERRVVLQESPTAWRQTKSALSGHFSEWGFCDSLLAKEASAELPDPESVVLPNEKRPIRAFFRMGILDSNQSLLIQSQSSYR